jgi:hypothetical protein
VFRRVLGEEHITADDTEMIRFWEVSVWLRVMQHLMLVLNVCCPGAPCTLAW